ncbi:molecular chaperone [Enterovibrio sp. ZSDZ42]|uniref:Molecular chaperone n=1 Tax=Enterovibrio gelatinilyticus TaxID=2899819 RepID=A0ABT5R3F2_9GAMM|nr:molecular chaperone [Enterovibrio sp. ZSDZ42]MDD1794549.1 molecular chaperone [Enterovibrio sp. ZSDZ42]
MSMQIVIRSVLVLFGLLAGSPSYAYKVQPMIAEMTPTGRGAQISMRIDNTNDFPLTVEVLPLKLKMNKQGKETLTPADNDLLVIPVTAIIAPGKSQSVTVRYLGAPDITESQAYRISVRQLNVLRNENDVMNVGLLMRFDTLMNVKPDNTDAKLRVANVSKNNKDWLVEVENIGTNYGRINEMKWTVKSGGKTHVIEGIDIGDYIQSTFVLPKSTRIFVMKPVEGFNASNTTIELSTESSR